MAAAAAAVAVMLSRARAELSSFANFLAGGFGGERCFVCMCRCVATEGTVGALHTGGRCVTNGRGVGALQV